MGFKDGKIIITRKVSETRTAKGSYRDMPKQYTIVEPRKAIRFKN